MKALPKSKQTSFASRWPLCFLFMWDELHEALIPEVYLFLDHAAYMLFFQRQTPSALQLHWKTLWQAVVEVCKIQEIEKIKVQVLG